MKLILKCHVVLLSLIFPVLASAADAALVAHPGFYSTNLADLPTPVRAARTSVFTIDVVDLKNTKVVDVHDQKSIQTVRQSYSHLPAYMNFVRKLVMAQIDACVSRQETKTCTLYFPSEEGSAFLIGNGHTLVTALHVLLPYLASRNQDPTWDGRTGLAKGIPLLIFDADNQLVFNGIREGQGLVQSRINHSVMLNNGNYLDDQDFIELDLPQDIGRPLSLADQLPPEHSEIFVLGAPAGTGIYRDRADYPDLHLKHAKDLIRANALVQTRQPFAESTGDSLMTSFGILLSDTSTQEFIKEKEVHDPDHQMILTTADCSYGDSGGPMLNAQGQVIGLTTECTATFKHQCIQSVDSLAINIHKVLADLQP